MPNPIFFEFTAPVQPGTTIRSDKYNSDMTSLAVGFESVSQELTRSIRLPIDYAGSTILPSVVSNSLLRINSSGDFAYYPLSSFEASVQQAANSSSASANSATQSASSATQAQQHAGAAQGSANTASNQANAAQQSAVVASNKADEAAASAAIALQAADDATSGFVPNSDVRLSDSREWTAQTISEAEAQGGSSTTRRAWTAQRVRQAITAYAVSLSDSRLTNSREWTAAQVSQAEAEAGTATANRKWTAQRVRQAIVAYSPALTDTRLTNSREWTGVTISRAEAEAGTATTRRAFTAQRVAQAISAIGSGLFMRSSGLSAVDCNAITADGFYKIGGSSTNCWPEFRSGDTLIHAAFASTYAMQIGGSRFQRFWVRYNFNGAWGDWQELVTAQNIAQNMPRVYLNGNATLVDGNEYHINGNRTLTLPTGSPVGTKIRLTKRGIDTVTINRGGSEVIRHPDIGTDTQVIWDIHAEIVFVKRTSTEWEI